MYEESTPPVNSTDLHPAWFKKQKNKQAVKSGPELCYCLFTEAEQRMCEHDFHCGVFFKWDSIVVVQDLPRNRPQTMMPVISH